MCHEDVKAILNFLVFEDLNFDILIDQPIETIHIDVSR